MFRRTVIYNYQGAFLSLYGRKKNIKKKLGYEIPNEVIFLFSEEHVFL